jgi:hypothetical protein
MPTFFRAFLASLPCVALSSNAWAHSGNPAVAFLQTPVTCNATVAAGGLVPIRWLDSDVVISTGTATVDLWATQTMPETFPQGVVPEALMADAMAVASGIREADRNNVHWWDTTNVPSGTYFIFSTVNEPSIEMSVKIVTFSPGTLTVVRPGDVLEPSILVVKPDSPFRFADENYVLEWCSRDPYKDGRVKIEVKASRTSETTDLLATDLPANGTLSWNTRCLYEENYAIKVTVTSTTTGTEHEAWGRYFLFVSHPFAPRDAGGLNQGCMPDGGFDDAGPDAGVDVDAGILEEMGGEGCDCSSASPAAPGLFALCLLGAWFILRRR